MLTEVTEEMKAEHQRYARIKRAIGAMPYGGIVATPVKLRYVSGEGPRNELGRFTLDDVAEYLEKLGEVLNGVATRSEDEKRELLRLRAQRKAVGDFLLESMAEATR